jgi:hypothetical protein
MAIHTKQKSIERLRKQNPKVYMAWKKYFIEGDNDGRLQFTFSTSSNF